MSVQRIITSVSAARHRWLRTTAVAAGVAVLIAAGGVAATKVFYPDASEPQPAPASSDHATPSDQVMRELRESIAKQYGGGR